MSRLRDTRLARRRWAPLVAAALGVMTAGAPAAAEPSAQTSQPPPDGAAAAQLLFEQGQALSDAGRFAEACPKFAESLKLDPGIGTMLWLADCYESSGRTASAWAQFEEAADRAVSQHDAREQVARSRASALQPKLSRVVVVVPPESVVAGLAIERDGVAVGSAEYGVQVPVDPGQHRIQASAPGRIAWETTIDVGEGARVVPATIPPLAPPPAPTTKSGADPALTAQAAPAPAAPVPEGRARRRTIGMVVAGLGGVGLATGSVAGLVAVINNNQVGAHCRTSAYCDPTGLGLQSTARDWATVADVGFGVGLSALGVAGVLWLTQPAAAASQPRAVRLAVAPAPGGIVMEGQW